MESETAAAAHVFVRTFSSSPRAYQPLFFCTGCHFWTLLPFLSVFVTFSLGLFSLTLAYKNRVITSLQGAITSVIQGSFMWRLGLKNGHLLLPPITHVSVFVIQSAACSEKQEMHKNLQMYAKIKSLEWKVSV